MTRFNPESWEGESSQRWAVYANRILAKYPEMEDELTYSNTELEFYRLVNQGLIPDLQDIPSTPADIGAQPAGDYATNANLDATNANLDATNANLDATNAQLTAFQGTAASTEELSMSMLFGGFPSNADTAITSNRDCGVWIAPFTCKITWASWFFDYLNMPVDSVNFLEVYVKKYKLDGSNNSIVGKKTNSVANGGAIQQRVSYGYSNANWDETSRILAEGETLSIGIRTNGTAQFRIPFTFTFRYRPL